MRERHSISGPGPSVVVRQHRSWATALLAVVVILAPAACAGTRSSICGGYDTLRDAVEVMKDAQGAADGIEAQIDEVDALVRSARRQLTGAGDDPRTAAATRAFLEAANYLEYMVGQYRDTGTVDFSITQFASRELTRALSGAGGPRPNC